MQLKLSTIIVNYNVKYFLETCLLSVTEACSRFESEIFVVDNASSDDSIAYLKGIFPNVIFIENKENIGFGRANNLALSKAKGEFILFLNPDTILAKDTFDKCFEFVESISQRKKIGGMGVKMLDGKGIFLPESKRSFPSASVSFFKLSGLEKLFPTSKLFGKYSLGFLNKNETHPVEVLAGAFMLFPKNVLDIIGGFDEKFFMYGEDIDLCYRAAENGFQNYYLGNVPIVHFKGESTKKGSLNYTKAFYGAMILFIQKHYSKKRFLKRTFLQAGVYAGSFLSLLKTNFTKKSSNQNLAKAQKYLLAGDEQSKKEAEKILTKKNKTTSYLNDFSAIENLSNEALVLCVGENFSLKNAFSLLKNINEKNMVMWHYHQSSSILCSMDKNGNGDVLF